MTNGYVYLLFVTDDNGEEFVWSYSSLDRLLGAVSRSGYRVEQCEVVRAIDGPWDLVDDIEFDIDLDYELRKAGYVKED